jgi:hypothetical protein
MERDELYTMLQSCENVMILTRYLIDYPQQIEQLIDIGLNDPNKETWRAFWIADKIHEKKPKLIQPYIEGMVDALGSIDNPSKLRHLLKLISLNDIPEEKLSFLIDYGIQKMTDPTNPVAIRVHAMQILYAISEQEPGFKLELIQMIEHEMEYHTSGGINARGKSLLKKLYQSV